MKIVGFDDVQIEFDGCRYFIECKRPFFDRRFEDNLGKAYDQLAKSLNRPNDRALAAIALEKVIAVDDSIQDLDSSPAALAFAKSTIDELRPRIIGSGTTKDIRTVGILFITRFLMHTKTAGTLAMNYLLGTVPLGYGGSDSTAEGSRLLRLTAKVHDNFQSMDTGFH